MNIYLWLDNQVTGPFSASDLIHRLESGILDSQILACLEGDEEWKPLGQILAVEPSDRLEGSLPENEKEAEGNERLLEAQSIFSAQAPSRKSSKLRTIRIAIGAAAFLLFACLGVFAFLYFPSRLSSSQDFFRIGSIQFLEKEAESNKGVWKSVATPHDPWIFQPCLIVRVMVRENIRSDRTIAKAYFYNQKDQLIFVKTEPSPQGKQPGTQFATPFLFTKEKGVDLLFEVPDKVRKAPWKAVVVFGDDYEAAAICYPPAEQDSRFGYLEKKLVHNKPEKRIERVPDVDPLIEYVVDTQSPIQPQMTFFLRLPPGVRSARKVEGVLAVPVFSLDFTVFKRKFQGGHLGPKTEKIVEFANEHRMAILAWECKRYWDVNKNYNELNEEEAKTMDQIAADLTDAWERGIKGLVRKYGLPEEEYLLWGCSSASQWAARLCLRKPEYFLAIHVHVPSSFDRPTPGAASVLWCLTTGELEPGYERSRQFLEECKKIGYPILYKAIVGLSHDYNSDADSLGRAFFEFALTQKEHRRHAKGSLHASTGEPVPWPEAFRNPPFYGDMVNQEVYAAKEAESIPASLRTSLPTRQLADAWSRSQ